MNTLEQEAFVELRLSQAKPFRIEEYLGLVRIASVVLLIAVWEFFGRDVNPLYLSYPTAIVRAAVQLLITGEIQRQAIGSLGAYLVGLSAALVIGIGVGLLMGRYRLAEYLLDPYVYALAIAVHYNAWAFYGLVGQAATSGIVFIAAYVGPTLMAFSCRARFGMIATMEKMVTTAPRSGDLP